MDIAQWHFAHPLVVAAQRQAQHDGINFMPSFICHQMDRLAQIVDQHQVSRLIDQVLHGQAALTQLDRHCRHHLPHTIKSYSNPKIAGGWFLRMYMESLNHFARNLDSTFTQHLDQQINQAYYAQSLQYLRATVEGMLEIQQSASLEQYQNVLADGHMSLKIIQQAPPQDFYRRGVELWIEGQQQFITQHAQISPLYVA